MARRGAVVEVVGRIPLLDAAVMHDADDVGDGKGLVLVVRDEDRGGAGLLEDVTHFEREPLAQLDIEIREWLVKQQQMRARGQRAGERDALLLAAREFVWILATLPGEPDQREQFVDAALSIGHTAQAEADVAGDTEMREQRIVLKHHADVAPLGRHAVARRANDGVAQGYRALRRRLETGDQP